MKLVYLIIGVILFLSLIYGEIYEYRGVVFYPNGSQNVDISKLYINYENPESFNIYIYYRDISIYIPYPKNITINLPPKKFKISIFISANKINDKWVVYYKIINNYSYNILFNVTFPDGFNIKSISVLVPSHSYKIITLSKIDNSPTLHFGEHNISFNVPGKVKIRYSIPIPFSIIKSNKILINGSIEWTATYIIKNTKSVPLNINVSYWAKVNNRKINFGNYSYILYPNENITKTFSIISNYVPIFYIKFYDWRDIYENITIKPAFKVGNSYIIGLAKVEGINFTTSKKMYISTITKSKNTQKNISIANKEEIKNTSSKSNLEQKTSNITTSKNKKIKRENVPLLISINEKKIKYAIIGVTTTIVTSLLTLLISLLFRKTVDIVDNGIFTIEDLEELYSTVYVPEGCKLGKILPGGITIVELNDIEKDLAKNLHETYNIPLNSAKAIVLGIKYGGRVFLSDEKAQEIALKIGLEVYPFLGGKVK